MKRGGDFEVRRRRLRARFKGARLTFDTVDSVKRGAKLVRLCLDVLSTC